ncbi:MAG: ComEA family DNA-binding protein [Candidatus Eremiobacteraeota bacterium]|nr:ComEA family DNA-binding protein [Candidatus Eremiobacteraeota bacterium]
MVPRIALIAAAAALAAFALWHPARLPVSSSIVAPSPLQSSPSTEPSPGRHSRGARFSVTQEDLVVYVAGAVRKPGLYHLRAGDRNAKAVALAGGMTGVAEAAGVNLAQRAQDGDEIYVPVAGERQHAPITPRRSRRHAAVSLAAGVDVNHSDAGALATVPGIGRAIAERIVELRERQGGFTSLDELLDVAGMTQTRLDRARPYLRQP